MEGFLRLNETTSMPKSVPRIVLDKVRLVFVSENKTSGMKTGSQKLMGKEGRCHVAGVAGHE